MKTDFSCDNCPLRAVCKAPCAAVETLLPSEDRGKLFSLRRKGALNNARRLHAQMREARFLIEHREVLTGKLRRVFDLTYNDGLTQEEIARRLGVHRRSVGNWLAKALDEIARCAMGDGPPSMN